MTRRSIRWRITALASTVLTVVLGGAAAASLLLVRHHLLDNLDHSLEVRADQIAAGLDEPAVALANSDGEDRYAQVLADDGRVLFATANLSGRPALLAPADVRDDDLVRTIDGFRTMLRRAGPSADAPWVLVGEDDSDVAQGLRAFATALAAVLPSAVIALALAVWWLVGRTLHPVERIRSEVASIGLAQLDHRVPVPGSGDEVARLATTMNEMLERLDHASRAQRQFVADASHELRTPLTRLRTGLEVELAHGADADLPSAVRGALGDAAEMEELVDDLLLLARADAGEPFAAAAPVDLDDVVDEEVRRARVGTAASIVVEALSPSIVPGPRPHVARVVRNLLSNAARHAATRVTVTVSETGGSVAVAVADDGPGIPPADRERIFDRFVRLDEARTAADGGAGLGLAIVRDVVTRLGGAVTVSDTPGGGATFTVTLPLHAAR